MKPTRIRALNISGDLKSGEPTLLDLRYGHIEDWRLIATFGIGDELVSVTFDHPVSFRITDEGGLIWYWMDREDSPRWAFASKVEGSAWLAEYAGSAASPDEKIRHYLFAGSDDCLEVLSIDEPSVTRSPRSRHQ